MSEKRRNEMELFESLLLSRSSSHCSSSPYVKAIKTINPITMINNTNTKIVLHDTLPSEVVVLNDSKKPFMSVKPCPAFSEFGFVKLILDCLFGRLFEEV